MDPKEVLNNVGDQLTEWAKMPFEWVGDQIKDFFVDAAVDFISAVPILAGVSIGVYALVGMVSKGMAKLSVMGVFGYGALLVVFA